MICSKCGTKLPDEALFCFKCGSKIEKKICKKCGKELPAESEFCMFCGVNLKHGGGDAVVGNEENDAAYMEYLEEEIEYIEDDEETSEEDFISEDTSVEQKEAIDAGVTDWITVNGKRITDAQARKVLFDPAFQESMKSIFDYLMMREFGVEAEHYDAESADQGVIVLAESANEKIAGRLVEYKAEKCIISMKNYFSNMPITVEYKDCFGIPVRKGKYYDTVIPTLGNYEELKIPKERDRSLKYSFDRRVVWMRDEEYPEKSFDEVKEEMMWRKNLIFFPQTQKIVRLYGIGPYCVADNGIWYEKEDELYFLSAVSMMVTKLQVPFKTLQGFLGITSIRLLGDRCIVKYAVNLCKTKSQEWRTFMAGDGEAWADEFVAEAKEIVFHITDYVNKLDLG